jgi:hypothetical protein
MRRYMDCHPYCYVVALYYLDTIIGGKSTIIVVNDLSVHRVYLAWYGSLCSWLRGDCSYEGQLENRNQVLR